MNKKNIFTLLFMVLPALILTSCQENTINSVWNNQIKIDGFYSDWESNLHYSEKSKAGLGAANDSSYLYLCLVSADQQLQRRLLFRGFQCKVDVPGSKRNVLEIIYPTGMKNRERSMRTDMPLQGEFRPNRSRESHLSIEDLQTEFRLLGPRKDDQRIVPLENNLGIEIKFGRSKRQFVYELRLPFSIIDEYLFNNKSQQYSELTITFDLPELESKNMPMHHGEGRRGGMEGTRSGPGGMDGEHFGHGMPDRGQDLKLVTRVVLANPVK